MKMSILPRYLEECEREKEGKGMMNEILRYKVERSSNHHLIQSKWEEKEGVGSS